MAILTVTERGQVAFRKDVLQHLGIGPAEKLRSTCCPTARPRSQPPARPVPFTPWQAG